MKKLLIGALLVLVLAAASYAATTYIVGRRACTAVAPAFSLLHDYLGLSDAQRGATSELVHRYSAQRETLRDRMLASRDHLIATLRDPKSTRNDALEAVRDFGEAQRALQVNTVEYTYALRDHLTPAQREKMTNVLDRGICALTCGPSAGRRWSGSPRGTCGMSPGCGGPGRGGRQVCSPQSY